MAKIQKPTRAPVKTSDRLVIDDREQRSGLAEEIGRESKVVVKIERLEVGDVLIDRRILIERKTAADFAASLVDGRLFRQAAELRASAFEPVFIVEGEFTTEALGGCSIQSVRGALLSVALDWKVPVLRSKSVADTARWIAAILTRESKKQGRPDWRWIAPTGERMPRAKIEARPLRRRSRSGRSARSQAIEMLGQIDGIGPKKAEALLDRFGTVGQVLRADRADLIAVNGISREIAERIAAVGGGSE